MLSQKQRDGYTCDLGIIPYKDAWEIQKRLVSSKIDTLLLKDVFLFLEHPPVFTIGRQEGGDNLHVTQSFLQNKNIPFIKTERGGNITYHGPGQLVVYIIYNIDRQNLRVDQFVSMLENVMIRTIEKFHIQCERHPRNKGVFIGDRKIGSIGIALRRGITFHGIALNINVALEPFSWINPCGLKEIQATSLYEESGIKYDMELIKTEIKHQIRHSFCVDFEDISIEELESYYRV